MINTIIFDLGNVLIKWDPKLLYRKIFPTEAEVDLFLNNICTMDWNELQDGGRPWSEAIDVLVPKYPSYEKAIRAYWERWDEMLNGQIDGTVEILKSVIDDDRYHVYALTNWSAQTFPIAQRQFEFLKWFEGIVVSGEEKLKKPDLAIYELILKRYDIDPTKAVFIDDSLRNIKAAQKVGLQTIHFLSPEQLNEEMDMLNILTTS